MRTTTLPLFELGVNELDAAAQAAHDVCIRLTMVQKILVDIPQMVIVDDVTTLYDAYRTAESLERTLNELRTRLVNDGDNRG